MVSDRYACMSRIALLLAPQYGSLPGEYRLRGKLTAAIANAAPPLAGMRQAEGIFRDGPRRMSACRPDLKMTVRHRATYIPPVSSGSGDQALYIMCGIACSERSRGAHPARKNEFQRTRANQRRRHHGHGTDAGPVSYTHLDVDKRQPLQL